MMGVEIGMVEPGCVQTRQRGAQAARHAPPLSRPFFCGEDSSEFHPRRFAHQQKRAALAILARRQPLRAGQSFALERLQHSGFS